MKQKLLHSLGPAIVLSLLAGAFWILHHELRHYHYADITRALAKIPRNRLLLSFALTVLSYVMLTGYDALALRHVRHPLAYGRIALASFIGYALSHNIGLSLFAGSAIRQTAPKFPLRWWIIHSTLSRRDQLDEPSGPYSGRMRPTMATTSVTSVGSEADAPAPLLRPSPVTGHAAEIPDV